MVSTLRQTLPEGESVLRTDGLGYRLSVTDGSLDLLQFELFTSRAREWLGAGRNEDAVRQLRSALGLWRGPVLAGLTGDALESARATLEERRLAASELYFTLQLDLGYAEELVPELRERTGDHPLRETLRAQLMLALYRSGRQAEAVAEYGRVRELLAQELGIDPSPRLARLYEEMLRANPELHGPAQTAAVSEAQVPVPSVRRAATPLRPSGVPGNLPHVLADFTGRNDVIEGILQTAAAPAAVSRVIAIDGMGGSGKTALAVNVARQLVPGYPDGQLFLDLHGFSSGQEPLSASAALHALLRALGVPAGQVPEDVDGRRQMWHSQIAGRRMLLLLDNVHDLAPVKALLPGSTGMLTLITSRHRLVDLDGADWFTIGGLTPADSAALLRRTLGPDRFAAEPDVCAELVEECGRLPLALRMATGRLRNRPTWSVGHLVERMRRGNGALSELRLGARNVAESLRLSYAALDGSLQRAFLLLAHHVGPDLDAHRAAALLDIPADEAEGLLDALLDAHLLEQHEPERYVFHSLVRHFALRQPDPGAGPRPRLMDSSGAMPSADGWAKSPCPLPLVRGDTLVVRDRSRPDDAVETAGNQGGLREASGSADGPGIDGKCPCGDGFLTSAAALSTRWPRPRWPSAFSSASLDPGSGEGTAVGGAGAGPAPQQVLQVLQGVEGLVEGQAGVRASGS
jgi:DNA-binding SARP family transcriptional activator